jgi:hypothetical protein
MNEVEIENLAKAMARSAGMVWDQLSAHPTRVRRWRNEARRAIRRAEHGTRSLH